MIVKPTVSQFNVGELSPLLKGRVDFDKYNYSSQIMSNYIATVEGYFHRRGGSHFVDNGYEEESNSSRIILSPFNFSRDISFLLEFGNRKIRFFKNHEAFLDGDVIYEIDSPYDDNMLWDTVNDCPNIQTIQCADVIYIFCEDTPIKTLSRYANNDWRLGDLQIKGGPFQAPNIDDNLSIIASATTGFVTLTATGSESIKTYIDFVDITLPYNGRYYNSTCDLTITISLPDIQNIVHTQYFVSPSGFPYPQPVTYRVLPVVSNVLNNNLSSDLFASVESGNYLNIDLKSARFAGENMNISITTVYRDRNGNIINTQTKAYDIVLSNLTSIFKENDVGRIFRLNARTDNINAWQPGGNYGTGSEVYSDGNWYVATSSGSSGGIKPVHTDGTRSDGGVFWQYKDSGYGIVRITEYISETEVKGNVELTLHSTLATSYWERGLLGGSKNPKCGTFFKGRLWFLIETKSGLFACSSCSNDFNNFEDKTNGLVEATNSIVVPLLSDLYNTPCWISGGEKLFVGTSGTEFYIDSFQNSTLSPDNVQVVKTSNTGSKPIKPVNISGNIIFVDRFGTSLRSLNYNYETDGFEPIEITLFSNHLFKNGIVEIVYQEYPESILWCTIKNGDLIGITLDFKQGVVACHQHHLSGYVESFAVVNSPTTKKEDLWVSVRREVNGETKRFIEWIDNGFPLEYPDNINNIQDISLREKEEKEYYKQQSFYLDSGIIWVRPEGNTDTSIPVSHLIGKEVVIMADGSEAPTQTVSAEGTITIRSKDKVVKVGLPIDSIFKSQNIFIPYNNKSGVGSIQQISNVDLMLYMSGSAYIGRDSENAQEILLRKADAPMDKSYDLFSGIKRISFDGSSSRPEEYGASVTIITNNVFPFNVLSISPKMNISEDI